jgi:Cu(I)/Ag(I) efflux system membrane fusion protein
MRRCVFSILVAVAACGGQKQPPPAGTMDMKGMQMPAGNRHTVRLTADEVGQFGVTFDTVRVRPLTTEVRATGTVVNDETKVAQVALKIGGYVERLYVNQMGQRVERGQPLVSVYSPDVVAAQDELLVAARLDSTAGSASSLVDAGKRRLRAWGVSDDQIERVLRTGKVEHTVTLTAPVSGVVIEKKVVQGQAIQAGDMLLSLAELSDVWINADVREADASNVHVGSRATIELPSDAGRSFDGRVSFVQPTVQSDARVITARIVVANPEGLLKPGMYATVGLATPARRALSVPSSALLHTGDRTLAFVARDDGSLMPRDVTIGQTAGELTEVRAGLDPGERVVTSAQYLLDSESNLAEVMKSMIGQGGQMDSMRDMPGMELAPPRQDSTRRR